MNALFVMRRPGIIVVSGFVKEVHEGEVVIENDCYFPVSDAVEKARCHLEVAQDVIDRMKITTGAAVIASTTDSFLVEMLMEGAETSSRDFHLKAYTLRYNGSFDFERHGQEKECHVFSGNLLNVQSYEKEGRFLVKARLAWKRKGREEVRNLVFWSKDDFDSEKFQNKRVVSVTGEAKQNGNVPFYVVSSLFTL